MKVRVDFTLDIDAAAWEQAYGYEGAKAIRDDVKGYVENGVKAYLQANGFLEER